MNRKMILHRMLQIVIILLGVSFFSFCLIFLSPGDPAEVMLTKGGNRPSPELLEATREEMGLNRPFFLQYGSWLWGAVRGDLGNSISSKQPVATIILNHLPATIWLSLASLTLTLIISLPLGILAAVKRNGFWDYMVRGLSFLGISMPGFWLGLMLLYYLGLKMSWFPIASTKMSIHTIVLPALTLAIAMSAKYIRQVRTAFLEEMGKDYVLGAQAHGFSQRHILWKQVLPNAFLPLITILGLSIGSLLGGTAVVEIIFSWPGLGRLAVESITNRDYPLVQGIVLWMALIYSGVNLLVDASYTYFDPRLRKQASGGQ